MAAGNPGQAVFRHPPRCRLVTRPLSGRASCAPIRFPRGRVVPGPTGAFRPVPHRRLDVAFGGVAAPACVHFFTSLRLK